MVALVGMPGSGKSEAAAMFSSRGYAIVRFGDITEEEIRARGLAQNPSNERLVRQDLRAKYGMAAYAVRSAPRIDAALKAGPVVADGMYSWEEYLELKKRYGDSLITVALWAPPRLRYQRLAARKVRPLTGDEARLRDRAEIEELNKGGPIAMADHAILNDGNIDGFRKAAAELASALLSAKQSPGIR